MQCFLPYQRSSLDSLSHPIKRKGVFSHGLMKVLRINHVYTARVKISFQKQTLDFPVARSRPDSDPR